MFHWRQLLGLRTDPDRTQDANSGNVRLLVITGNDQFYSAVVEAGSSNGWEVRRASSIAEGIGVVRSRSTPLVILDWDENGRDWRDGVRRLYSAHERTCVLLASRVVDDNLREEVLRFHGYDVLPKSAGREQMVRMVQFAWFWITRTSALAERAMKQES